jgi:hypothetical protein
MGYNYIDMKQNYSIFLLIALVGVVMTMCGRKLNFLLYTSLGRVIIVLSVMGLTIFNKYVGLASIILITMLYNKMDYREGMECVNPLNGVVTTQNVPEVSKCDFTSAPPDGGTSSGSSEVSQNKEAEDDEDTSEDD